MPINVKNMFLGPAGPIEISNTFKRAVWHDGDVLRANMINDIYMKQSNPQSAGLAIKHIVYENCGLNFNKK